MQAPVATSRVLLPQVDHNLNPTYPSFRAIWTDEATVGRGFKRETLKYCPPAIVCNPEGNPETVELKERYVVEVVDSVEVYVSSICAAGIGQHRALANMLQLRQQSYSWHAAARSSSFRTVFLVTRARTRTGLPLHGT